MANKYMSDPDYLFAVLTAMVKKFGGSITLSKEELSAAQKGDFKTAFKEWKPSAEQGNKFSQYNLGVLYNLGRGVSQDYKEAFKWFSLSTQQGHEVAQRELGVMYYKGVGTIQDYIYAHMWLNISASNGYELSLENRDLVAKSMTSSQIQEAQRLARECVKKNYKGC